MRIHGALGDLVAGLHDRAVAHRHACAKRHRVLARHAALGRDRNRAHSLARIINGDNAFVLCNDGIVLGLARLEKFLNTR